MLSERKKILGYNLNLRAFLIGFGLLVATFFSNAQSELTKDKLNTASNSINYKIPGKQFYSIYMPSGSEFFDIEWKTGYVILENGDKYDNIHLKYNTLKDEIITLNGRTSTMIMIDKDAVSEFGLYQETGQVLQFKKLKFDKGTKDYIYFNILYEGNLELLIWQRTIEEKTSPYKDRNGYLQVSEYNLRPQIYLCFPDDEFERFRFKRGSFLSLFKDKKKEVRKLLRQNNIHLRTQADYISAIKLIEFEYYSN